MEAVMYLLILGLVLFLGVHLIPALPGSRASLAAALGPNRYKGVFSIVSAIGLVALAIGYARAPGGPALFQGYPAAIRIAPLAMIASFILLAASHTKSHLRAWLRHPMLLGVGLWALVHLLANGSARASLLFGAFLAYVVIDLISALRRNSAPSFAPVLRHDLIAVIAGTALALLVMAVHRQLFGVAAVPWGL
jgi:uncharacterized membrane protein